MAYSKEIDKKWQKKWKEENLYRFDEKKPGKKFYTLEMFSYPSGANLHLGHWFNFAPADSFARFKSMQGYNVFHPMGFDAFGLPAENYAIKTGIHPQDSTIKNIATMKKQLEEMGATYDWNYSVETCMSDYYKWTQWLFLQLYKNGLAYKKEAPVNWCSSCNTVLANEQVINGACERCKTIVEKKKLNQWFFKITDYAEELLEGLETLDWPEATKKIQTNWIGKSKGAEITFKTENKDIDIKVFTTRPDTLCGVTYVVLAPESDLVDKLTKPECQKAIEEYRQRTIHLSEIERMSTERTKTGTFTGSYAINPINGTKVPIWISDYVLEGYGTGCVMAVPAHDERDFEFAKKYQLPMIQVIDNKEGTAELPYVEDGILINSNQFNGLTVEQAKKAIVKELEKTNSGKETISYKLKDWLVSRQRYWGAPIPMINCPDCGLVPVPEKDLPVLLPYDVEFTPDGESPLKKCKEFMHCTCPKCGKDALREPDTLDTFVCSSWYYLRYPDAKNEKEAFNKEIVDKMLPVDVYVGGKEHAAMHLIYARFITKALRDLGFLDFDEPFQKLVHQGMILGPDGNKMSKSKGNTVAPDTYIDAYGSDVFRLYLMFGFSYTDGGPWKDEGIKAISKYVSRVENLIDKVLKTNYKETEEIGEAEKSLLYVRSNTIKCMEEDIGIFQFNTAIARSMELVNELVKYEASEKVNKKLLLETIEDYIKIMSPLAPHFTEELWEKIGKAGSVHKELWPKYKEEDLHLDTIEIPVQINGKLKAVVKVGSQSGPDDVKEIVKKNATIAEALKDKTIKKEVYVPKKIYSIVISQ